LLSGEIQFMVTNMATALPQVKLGRLKGLAVTGAQRLASVPELPTAAEAGLAGYEYTTWYAMLVPAGTPAPVAGRIHHDAVSVIREREVMARFVAQGLDVHGTSREEFGAFLTAEVAKWSRVTQMAGLTAR